MHSTQRLRWQDRVIHATAIIMLAGGSGITPMIQVCASTTLCRGIAYAVCSTRMWSRRTDLRCWLSRCSFCSAHCGHVGERTATPLCFPEPSSWLCTAAAVGRTACCWTYCPALPWTTATGSLCTACSPTRLPPTTAAALPYPVSQHTAALALPRHCCGSVYQRYELPGGAWCLASRFGFVRCGVPCRVTACSLCVAVPSTCRVVSCVL